MSSKNLPLPTSPQQTLETLPITPHCTTCALYALTRAKLKRTTCRNCATKAYIDSPVLLLYLFAEFQAFSNALKALKHREKDLMRTVAQEFDHRLSVAERTLGARNTPAKLLYLDPDSNAITELCARLDSIEKEFDRLKTA